MLKYPPCQLPICCSHVTNDDFLSFLDMKNKKTFLFPVGSFPTYLMVMVPLMICISYHQGFRPLIYIQKLRSLLEE